eukprot:CAMPEP_0204620564 /NCGR_PEP_ID=MMETSP0717-20131115/6565_1 /ASSEMBLY_ACC=CAM_ASM_000666 /TAXON_ID=230516 /ORGANISM="Chaetoceros curvisetus" /LENGTH=344 /DNA_ID=CAMNT_0051634795 /DNA_START=159 /DNA_END=1193 /DNA_ORIENTATION=-
MDGMTSEEGIRNSKVQRIDEAKSTISSSEQTSKVHDVPDQVWHDTDSSPLHCKEDIASPSSSSKYLSNSLVMENACDVYSDDDDHASSDSEGSMHSSASYASSAHSNNKPFPPPTEATQKVDVNWLNPTRENNKAVSQMSPDTYIEHLFQSILGFTPVRRRTLELSTKTVTLIQEVDGEEEHYEEVFISPITEEELANYGVDVVSATREDQLDVLRDLHENGRSLSCCNRYGESLMHMACRRGFTSIVNFLTAEAGVAIRITDDCGRTPLHDAFWHRECQYEIVDLLIRSDPCLLLLCDKHGHTPFAYSRREHWGLWKQFLWDRREHMQHAMDTNVMELFKLKI